MISVAYINITVRYSLKTGRENRKLSQIFSVSLFFYLFFFVCFFYIKYVLYEGAKEVSQHVDELFYYHINAFAGFIPFTTNHHFILRLFGSPFF